MWVASRISWYFSLLFSFKEDILTKSPFDGTLIFPIVHNLFVLPPHPETLLSTFTSSSSALLPFPFGKYSYSCREPWGSLDDGSQLSILYQNLFFYPPPPSPPNTLHIRVRTHSCLCFATHQVSLFLPLFPCCSNGIRYSLQSQMLHSSLLSCAGSLDWGLEDNSRSAVGAGCTPEGGSLSRCVLISTCKGRVDTCSCPIHLERE